MLLERIDDNWLLGRNADNEGIFPQRHIRIVKKLASDMQMVSVLAGLFVVCSGLGHVIASHLLVLALLLTVVPFKGYDDFWFLEFETLSRLVKVQGLCNKPF